MNKMLAALILMFSVSASASDFVIWAPHPASAFLQNAVNKAQAVIADKGDAASKVGPLCKLIKETASMGYIGGVWLGNYRTIATDQAGVKAFIDILPSFFMTKVMSNLTDPNSSITVSPQATERDPKTWAVGVKAVMDGKSYNAQAIVREINGQMRLIDGEYFGMSGVGYMKSDFQKKFDAAAKKNPKTPVSDVVNEMASENGFVRCP